MLSCVGVGAIVAALYFPRWRARFGRDTFVWVGTLVQAGLSSLIVAVPQLWVALPAMVVIGMAWISVANSLTVSAQLAMPDWVRARGMSIYQMALMGGAAAGSLLWGQVAKWVDVDGAIWAAAIFGCAVLLATRRHSVGGSAEPDYRPASLSPPQPPAFEIGADEGPVMVTVEYQIDPARAAEFAEVMQRTRRARLRQGALSWGLFRDVTVPGRYIEYFVDETWVEHQRRLERFTAFDAGLRDERLAFHLGEAPPTVRRYVGDAHLAPSEGPPSL
jgi:MFS family permease